MKKICLSVAMVFLFLSNPTFAITQQEAQNELNQINRDINSINSTLNGLRAEKNTLANELAILDAQSWSIQLQLNSAQAQIYVIDSQISDTNTQIAKAEADLLKQKELLQEYIKTMYLSGQTSQIELILTSNSFSDFVDQNQYLDTMAQKVQDATNQVQGLKKELESKKKDLSIKMDLALQLKATQVSAKNALDIQASQKSALLQATNGSESAYQSSLNGKVSRKGILECIASGGCGGDASGQLQVVNSGYRYTHYYQWQSPWGNTSYDGIPGDTFANYGCLITSLAMAHGKTPPQEAASHSFDGNGYMISDGRSGTSIGLDWNRINSTLANGGNLIFGLHMGGYDHYVLAVGMSSGKYLIYDPYFESGYTYNSSRVFKALIP